MLMVIEICRKVRYSLASQGDDTWSVVNLKACEYAYALVKENGEAWLIDESFQKLQNLGAVDGVSTWGENYMFYHFENLCREDPTIRLNDGTEKVFLNTKVTSDTNVSVDDMEEDLRNLLKYFESKVPQDTYTRELEEAVTAAKEHREWRREYMKLEAMTQRIRREEREEGETTKLVSQIYRKAVKGKTPEEIAEDLEEELSEVKRIYDAVVKYLPDYEPEKILAELKGVQTGVRN